MDMTLTHKELFERAQAYLKEVVPDAKSMSFEELSTSSPLDNPPNAIVVVLSYRDPAYTGGLGELFSKKMKSVYMAPESGELLAIKSKFG